ncbi:MAG: hypothetical protein ACJ77A_01355 [Actinomycetota bacterium]
MSDDLIQVPRRLLEELAGYLDRAGEPTVTVPGNGPWTQAMVLQLKTEIGRYPAAVAVGDEAARKAGNLVGLSDIAQESGFSKQEISNALAAMSKATRRLFGEKRWPFQAVDTAEGMHYLMQAEIAEWWTGA